MGLKTISINSLQATICAGGFIATFHTMIEIMYFLSDPHYNRKSLASRDIWLTSSWGLLVNMSLLSIFMLQHTLMANPKLKSLAASKGLDSIYRSIYIICTAGALRVLLGYWIDLSEVAIWRFDLNSRLLWWSYTVIHVLSWLIIYVGNICMDVNELLGVKQVYYSIVNLPDPNLRKSFHLRRLNSHMRHPSFLGFLLIFWTVPIMSLDRLLLASIFTIYMYATWNTDEEDYAYQKSQYIRKFHELERVHG